MARTQQDEYELGFEEFYFDVLMPSIPFAGLCLALTFGVIDLGYESSREQGKVRIAAALVTHIVYVLALVVVIYV